MSYCVKKKEQVAVIQGTLTPKFKYHVINENNNDEIYVLDWKDLDKPIIYDKKTDDFVNKFNWFCHLGYAVTKKNATSNLMHRMIMLKEHPTIDLEKYTVDHINEIKSDNRLKNMRFATQSEQNSNRSSRSDKKPPPDELKDMGVTEYPRHVRWDKTEKKFIIENHPMLVKQVEEGKIKKAAMSGTKSARFTIVQKYQDILAKLKELDDLFNNDETGNFKALKNDLKKEYTEIVNAIRQYENAPLEEVPEPPILHEDIAPIAKTVAGRKTQVKLPENCGVTVDMIPKYCWYRAATEKRGDAFFISHYPNMIKKSWNTTSSRDVTTLEKYNMLMEIYNSLPPLT